MRIDPAAERDQVARLQAFRAARDPEAWAAAMDRLAATAAGSENLVPAIIDAVKAGGTLGEMSDRLREAWGRHRELVTV